VWGGLHPTIIGNFQFSLATRADFIYILRFYYDISCKYSFTLPDREFFVRLLHMYETFGLIYRVSYINVRVVKNIYSENDYQTSVEVFSSIYIPWFYDFALDGTHKPNINSQREARGHYSLTFYIFYPIVCPSSKILSFCHQYSYYYSLYIVSSTEKERKRRRKEGE
jgi:hypothetical protein